MKTALLLLAALLLALPARAQNLTGSTLAIGTGNAAQPKSAVIGNNNQLAASSATLNLLAGESNWINSGTANLAVGTGNGLVSTGSSVLLGSWNSSNGALSSLIVGTGNYHVSSDTSLTAGYNNYSTGWIQTLLGHGLISGTVGAGGNPCVVVGTFNVDKAEQRFVVGNGTDATHRANAFEINRNGDIKMGKPQGDISMGEFAP